MLESIVADVLVRVLGSYVDGLNKESIRVGVWRGDLELKHLRLRPDALAVLFETLGLDLPVTVTAGYVGLLRLKVPWNSLRSAPVRIFMHDVTVIASPVSDGDQKALELRDRRLKAARLATDEALRDAKFSVRSVHKNSSSFTETSVSPDVIDSSAYESADTSQGSYSVTRWGWRFTSRVVTKIVDNIQIDVENVVVQYEDASSVRDRPYTAMLAFDSLRACSTDRNWVPVFIENPSSPVVHKVVHMHGLVLNWEPCNSNNELKKWILDPQAERTSGQWSGLVRNSSRHAIRPLDGELRIALTKSSALALALSGKDPNLLELKNVPRVQMDLHFPEVKIALDDFQYHTLLSTIMYLSDIDRKVRPKTSRGRWFWALDRLLPRFKERREAALRFNVEDMRRRRELRERYCYARNVVVNARRKGAVVPTAEADVVSDLERQLSFEDVILFRNIADQELYENLRKGTPGTAVASRFWSLFSRGVATTEGAVSGGESVASTTRTSISSEHVDSESVSKPKEIDTRDFLESGTSDLEEPFSEPGGSDQECIVPNFRMGFLLGRGAIELKEGGFPHTPVPMSLLEFRELRLGVETRPNSGFLFEALLGTFEVIDLQKNMKVMYPRVPWAGEKNDLICDNASDMLQSSAPPVHSGSRDGLDEVNRVLHQDHANSRLNTSSSSASLPSIVHTAVLLSYPHSISTAISEIRGEYGIVKTSRPSSKSSSSRNSYIMNVGGGSSSGSLSALSESTMSGYTYQNREDLSFSPQSPLKYIAALRLNQEEAPEDEWASGATRIAMDLAIGGMEVLVDGPKGAFISSVGFWHPREKMPSIMQFLTRSAAPRLASLRMDIQNAILDRSVPMRMDILIRGPRFVIPSSHGGNVSLVLDLGTFAMETSTGPILDVHPKAYYRSRDEDLSSKSLQDTIQIRYTEYRMACCDLGLFVVSEAGKQAAERIVRPFSVHLLLQVLHNSSFVEAITLSYGKVNISKVKLQGKLPSLRTSVSHDAFRQILDILKGWGEHPRRKLQRSGIEPNRAAHSVSVSAEMEEVRLSHQVEELQTLERSKQHFSPLISFNMKLEFEDLQLELRDSLLRRVVTLSSTGTILRMKKRPEVVDFDYELRTFTVIDGSRGATAPFRRLAYAGIEKKHPSSESIDENRRVSPEDSPEIDERRPFIVLSYSGDLVNHEQSLGVKILSLNLVCVRETYFALADFFYLNEHHKSRNPNNLEVSGNHSSSPHWAPFQSMDNSNNDAQEAQVESELEGNYADPFAALGMTTSKAARALRHQANRGMEFSKQAIANRGKLSVKAELDGLNVTLVTAEGGIARFDVSDCKMNLTQFPNGSVVALGDLGGFGIRDLTSAFDVYSETVRYCRKHPSTTSTEDGKSTDGWSFRIPEPGKGDIWLEAHLKNIRFVYLQRFIVILKKYFSVLRESLKPVLEMKGGISEVFDDMATEDFITNRASGNRFRLSIITESVDIVMPRHSQSPYEALRFFVMKSSLTNEEVAVPGYQIGFQLQADGINSHVLYQPPMDGEGRALTQGGCEPVLRQISPDTPVADLTPFTENMSLVAKLDTWRCRSVPEVVLNADGIPVLKDGEEEQEYDPAKWLPTIRVRISAPKGICARLCEAEYSILYFTFTENVIERPDIEFTDIVRGLKTPVLPARKPVQPIMFSSNRMPPNYQIRFEVPYIESVIMSGGDADDSSARLIRTHFKDLVGCFEYGVDYRMSIEVSTNVHSVEDARPSVPTYGMRLIMPTQHAEESASHSNQAAYVTSNVTSGAEASRSVTLTWDRPFGFRANVMVVASDLRIIVEPELFRDIGALTPPGFPYLKSSAPPPLLRFNGRLLIVTISRPEIWLMASQHPGDGRSLVVRGDVIAKVQWAAVTGRNTVEVAAKGIRLNLSSSGPTRKSCRSPVTSPMRAKRPYSARLDRPEDETPMLYPCDVSMKFEGRGYDPPKCPGEEPIKASGSNLSVDAETILIRIDVNDAPLILAVGSRLIRLKASPLSERPVQRGRFDQWIDEGEDGDAKFSIHFVVPQSRLMFTDETAGRYVPIMEARIRNAVVRSNVPWLTNAVFEFALDLFNEEKGWWEPGIEAFPIEIAASKGRSGSQAFLLRTERHIDINVTPNTVSGAARVSIALKSAIEDLTARVRLEEKSERSNAEVFSHDITMDTTISSESRRPSVASFCVRNETGRSMMLWLPYDSTRRPIGGNGGEIEVDTPSEELLWTAMGGIGSGATDSSRIHPLSMFCVLCLNGYQPVTLSAEHMGNCLVTFVPDNNELSSPASECSKSSSNLSLVWSVAMRDGVPCGCIRSILRLVNKTRDVLEVNIGGFAKSATQQDKMYSGRSSVNGEISREVHGLVKAGEAWSIPIHAVHRAICLRPAIFHAPDVEFPDNFESSTNVGRGRVYYTYKWSDPLSKVSALSQIGRDLHAKSKTEANSKGGLDTDNIIAPVLVCRSETRQKVFCLSLQPKIDPNFDNQILGSKDIPGWVDVHLQAPLVLENFLPRPLFFRLATIGISGRMGRNRVIAEGLVEPLRKFHVHTIGAGLATVAMAVGMDNNPRVSTKQLQANNQVHVGRNVGEYHQKLPSLKEISTGTGRYTPFKLKLEHLQTVGTRYVRLFCEFWIRNRSDTDVFFRDREYSGEISENANPKVFLRACPPGKIGESFICFSGPWLSFQRADATKNVWTNMGTEVSEVDKPLTINLDGLSLIMDVRPARGRFQRALVVTIRNAAWLENRTGFVLQWCQPAALNPHGIALLSKVHTVQAGAWRAAHWDFHSQKKAICLRRASDNESSEWIWSRPVVVDGVEGEFAAKMYRPKRHEQYIARVVISRIGNGVSAIVVHKEDRNTPPYRIINHCNNRSIAFRQTGVNETHPWLVRPGKSTRYSWDDPQAPVKHRSLIVEVIEVSRECTFPSEPRVSPPDGKFLDSSPSIPDILDVGPQTLPGSKNEKEVRYPKFNLNIDIVQKNVQLSHSKKFMPQLKVSVHVDGPTKVVTFSDGSRSMMSKGIKAADLEKGEAGNSHMAKENLGHERSKGGKNLDFEVLVKGFGVSFVESSPAELAYLSITGVHIRLDRFDGQQLLTCEIQDLQLDNQLVSCAWPVVLWSPPPSSPATTSLPPGRPPFPNARQKVRKPFFQLTVDGPYPYLRKGIGTFRGIFIAVQQLQVAADEDFVYRVWLFVVSLMEAVGGSKRKEEALDGKDGLEVGLPFLTSSSLSNKEDGNNGTNDRNDVLLNRIYVEHLELCPLKLSISFTSSRTSTAAEHIGGFRSLIRTLLAVLGNVENAEFRFNALELQHVFGSASHFRSLIVEFYLAQCSNQRMVLLASNSLIGNPSALFDSIAIGTRDFFVEPANAKGSADFIASIGRGSSSLLTNTVGGLVGSLGAIPRAVAQGLETAVGDREYLAERDSIRGGRARIVSSPAQGLFTGALSFGHGIASGAAGLIRDPIQGASEDGPSGFIKGLGKGFIGGVLKPITGALDLIAEPAAGFHSMMVSERNKDSAEPVRPPRAFIGLSGDRMTSYDLRSSLGQAVLKLIYRGEDDHGTERLLSWTYLIPIHSSASEQDVILFLWALLRRSTRSSHFQGKYLLDAQGNAQRAEKMRLGLVTNKRIILTSLDGHLLWQYPLVDIVDTQVSVEAKDYLIVGVRPVGHNVSAVVAPTWKKVHCGSMASRDEMNKSLRNALEKVRAELNTINYNSAYGQWNTLKKNMISDHRRDASVEMIDMSNLDNLETKEGNMTEMKAVHQDASVDGRRGVFTDMKLPGRADTKDNISHGAIYDDGLAQQVAVLMNVHPKYEIGVVRSVRLLIVNDTKSDFIRVESSIESGRWIKEAPSVMESKTVTLVEADGTTNRIKDVSGSVVLRIESSINKEGLNLLGIKFINPLLAANAYAIQCPLGYTAGYAGGEKGDHAVTVVTVREVPNVSQGQEEASSFKRSKSLAEPLLFGRSKVTPYLPPITFSPPHAPKKESADPNDPVLVAKLSSLGFSPKETRLALQECDGDVSKAYKMLIEKGKHM